MLVAFMAEDYHPYSTGNFCNNGGKVPFLVEGRCEVHSCSIRLFVGLGSNPNCSPGLFEPGECVSRCTRAHNCAFVTLYRNGWCQLGSKCLQESPAGDSSAMTYAKATASVSTRPIFSAMWFSELPVLEARSPFSHRSLCSTAPEK